MTTTDPTRRQFLRGASLTALASSVAGCATSGLRRGRDERPNVLFLISDQHRADVAGFAGDVNAHTPNLDRLAAESARVSDVYCQVPLCAPARQSLLTGQYAHTHATFRNDARNYREEQFTLAHALSDAGYATALFGKTHCNTRGFEYVRPLDAMQSDFELEHPETGRPGASHYTFDKADPDYDSIAMMNPGYRRAGKGPEFFMEQAVAREAGDYIATGDGRPFFVWASFVNPHSPLFPPDRFYDLYLDRALPPFGAMTGSQPGLLGVHAWRRRRQGLDRVTDEQLQNIMRAYYASLAWTDHCIGELLASLDAAGRGRDTLVIYTSDHGEMLGQHGLLKKWVFYEAAVRVPLLMRWPGRIRPELHRRVVQHVDLTATLIELAGATVSGGEGMVGRSMTDLLDGRGSWDDVALSELPGGGDLHWMIRDGSYKYSWHGAGGVALYDLDRDPTEEHNLAWDASSSRRVAELHARFEELTADTVWNVRPRS